MTHPSDQDLTAYLDRELAVERSTDIERHLAACDVCATRVGTWVQLGEAMRDAPMAKPSLAAQSRWIDLASLPADRSVRRLASWMTAAASVILAATLSISFSNQAQATPMLSDWEAAAIAGPEAASDSSHATARLLAVDLSSSSQNGSSQNESSQREAN